MSVFRRILNLFSPSRLAEEIDAEIEALRDDAEEEMQAVERLQEECRRAREQARMAEAPPD